MPTLAPMPILTPTDSVSEPTRPPLGVFTISAGRTGTHYLATLFACVEDASGGHEELPIGVGPPMVAFAEGDEGPIREVAELKARIVRAKAGKGSYLEANHAFVKGYGWFLPELLGAENLRVIYLRRSPELVAKSLLRVRGVPGRTAWSRLWYSAPGQARNLAEPEPGASSLALGRWYAEEIERQARAYRERFPEVTVIEVTLEELNDFEFVRALFVDQLGLSVDEERLQTAVGTHTPDLNREFVTPPERAELEGALESGALESGEAGLRDPDQLTPAERAELKLRTIVYLREHHREDLLVREPGQVGNTIMTSIVRVVTGQSALLAKEFEVWIPNTDFEIDLILSLLEDLRPLDPMGLLFTRLPKGGLDLPAANTDGSLASVLPIVFGNALQRSAALRWSLGAAAILVATIGGYLLSSTLS